MLVDGEREQHARLLSARVRRYVSGASEQLAAADWAALQDQRALWLDGLESSQATAVRARLHRVFDVAEQLERLSLRANGLADEAASVLEPLAGRATLRSLDLSCNRLNRAGRGLGAILQTWRGLEGLSLAHNELKQSAALFVGALATLPALTFLDLAHNQIYAPHQKPYLVALSHCASLKELRIDSVLAADDAVGREIREVARLPKLRALYTLNVQRAFDRWQLPMAAPWPRTLLCTPSPSPRRERAVWWRAEVYANTPAVEEAPLLPCVHCHRPRL